MNSFLCGGASVTSDHVFCLFGDSIIHSAVASDMLAYVWYDPFLKRISDTIMMTFDISLTMFGICAAFSSHALVIFEITLKMVCQFY